MKNKSKFEFDVIVVGSGMSGGTAAKEFCEKGYKTLVLDRGKPIEHGNYPTEFKAPWEMEYRGKMQPDELNERQFIQKYCYALSDFTKHHFINDKENPYQQDKPFYWIRSAKVGGKSVLWHRHVYRWNTMDFQANKQDGYGVDWPVRYEDIAPWYDYVEPFIGIAGAKEGLDVLPDSIFQPPQPFNIVEHKIKAKIEATFPDRKVINGRVAHLTKPTKEQIILGRGACQTRNQCQRGCSWGGYYSSVSASLPAAKRTGNITLRANAQVQKVLYDAQTGKASRVQYTDTLTNETKTVRSRLVFMCASTLGTVQILMNSKSEKYPQGIGNSSGVLGHYIMDHSGGSGARGTMPGYLDSYYKGRPTGGIYIPRFANIEKPNRNFLRGYGYQGSAKRQSWRSIIGSQGIGRDFKNSIRQPTAWVVGVGGFGEMLPDYNNNVSLHPTKKDRWGMPLLITDISYGENTRQMKIDMKNSAVEMLNAAGLKDVKGFNHKVTPGVLIHEMGGACMGRDPKSSYLNKWSQSHEVANLFVTDGAAFASQSCVNPSLTYMALTARAVDFADQEMKAGRL